MRNRILAFIAVVLLGTAVIPGINLLHQMPLKGKQWWHREFLFNMDLVSEQANRVLSKFGISTDASQVVIGRQGWYYLGDRYDQGRTVNRIGQTPAAVEMGQRISDAGYAWNAWLKGQGVRAYRMMIAPDKETIYPEFLPGWARPASPSATDGLLSGTHEFRPIDLRPILRKARQDSPHPLYYQTDSHWNHLGAAIAFDVLARDVAKVDPQLRWPGADALAAVAVKPGPGGDLTRFLRISGDVVDTEVTIGLDNWRVDTVRTELETGRVVGRGGNPLLGSPRTPLLVTSPQALNQARVLWLRDSFGIAMSPAMSATFSEVLQLHWQEAFKPGRMVELVQRFKPDYVFVTVAERLSRSPQLASAPPLQVAATQSAFEPLSTVAAPLRVKDVTPSADGKGYRIVGRDPFIDFPVRNPVGSQAAPLVRFDLECVDGAASVPVQLFWLVRGEPNFRELHSARFKVSPGRSVIDLRVVPDWRQDWTIERLRFDIDAKADCQQFAVRDLELGTVPKAPNPGQ